MSQISFFYNTVLSLQSTIMTLLKLFRIKGFYATHDLYGKKYK